MKNLAVVTARSGSKGLKDKNIRLMAQKPLMAYTIESALESGMFHTVMVSTDSEEYAKIAKEYGAQVPFLRREETSGDHAGSWEVVKEVLSGYLNMNEKFDTVCLLQPTSPLRDATDIVKAYGLFEEKQADAITSVCECDHPIEYMMTLDNDMSLERFRKTIKSIQRQMCPQYYRLNGAVYIRALEYISDDIQIRDAKEYAFVMSVKNSVDIDTIDDFEYAEFLIKENLLSK
ncbi:MAG: acylneuraminate cytidylyltransferase family protein [Lachnospiraceae bacterium]|nr:acylneuraminate cytidylyltransferase family protein [Lachnospiraceae bacterium]